MQKEGYKYLGAFKIIYENGALDLNLKNLQKTHLVSNLEFILED